MNLTVILSEAKIRPQKSVQLFEKNDFRGYALEY